MTASDALHGIEPTSPIAIERTADTRSGTLPSSDEKARYANDDQKTKERYPDPSAPLPVGTSTGGVVTSEDYVSDEERAAQLAVERHRFRWSSLWQPAEVNPLNGRSKTFPLLRIWDPYAVAFWLATLGFFVAFLSWFAFSPLMPEAVARDLRLSPAQVTNANMASLGGTAIVRLAAGPACDRFGPRKVLAALLVLGALPSGLAALVTNIQGLEAVRFFISLLGGTFVATAAYTATFYDKNIVGTANAFAGGWGNLGGGVTVVVMISAFERLKRAGLSAHTAWRVCFPIIPVPCLLLSAAVILLLGKDHPAGRWSQRHQINAAAIAAAPGSTSDRQIRLDPTDGEKGLASKGSPHPDDDALYDDDGDSKARSATAAPPATGAVATRPGANGNGSLATDQSEPLTLKSLSQMLVNPRVWMCVMCYFLTFGLETALDAALPGLMTTLFRSATFSVEDAAYAASTYGLLNVYARPLGGIVSDLLYARYGLRARVYLLLVTAFTQGIGLIGLGLYCNYHPHPTVGGVIGFIVLVATTGFMANGAVYGVVPFTSPRNVGTASGLVGAGGNVGGLMYTLIFRYLPGVRAQRTLGTKFWVAGVVNAAAILPFALLPWGQE